ncbi:hypothetical protein OU787_20635 [Kitasatospora sp. YST-16]|uniref:hypothetical protein n=1 Tax=unclassified Kitasatospora TaxID=2633591 RepID=UPI0004C3946F|nr:MULTISPECIES: hypothetical protein [unclassified Kitasatospora]WAL73710.1 hypothetical protein OU787_20635 [Kitasatospora sp. YST-16]WNW39773.1 hypothetical protein RKE32_20595 [Streptomyces sp. Li-HN-5-13]
MAEDADYDAQDADYDPADAAYEAPRRRPWRRVLVGVLALAVVGGLIVWLNRDKISPPDEGCTITTAAGSGTLELTAAANAATITAVAMSRGLPERAVTISLATAIQESKLRNLEGGDRDSVGLFQQRPSQGWGTVEQIMNPVYATNKFLDALVKVDGYAQMPLTDAAQQVQRSGYPQAYAKHENDATLLSSVLTGREPASLDCVVHALPAPSPTDPAEQAPTAANLSERVRREFGKAVSVAGAQKAAKDPREVLAFTPQPTASTAGAGGPGQTGWALAHWSVAQAAELGIGQVAYDGKVWRVDRPGQGWKPLADAPSDRVLVTLGEPVKKK